ncbi:hypothetical protein ASD02_35785 [Ensifer sp. Root1252]|nr:hypothetical protein ASD02_35785 [Ensifer sp. Root1252]
MSGLCKLKRVQNRLANNGVEPVPRDGTFPENISFDRLLEPLEREVPSTFSILVDFDERNNVWMFKFLKRIRFALKGSLLSLRITLEQHAFDRYVLLFCDIIRFLDGSHPAFAPFIGQNETIAQY